MGDLVVGIAVVVAAEDVIVALEDVVVLFTRTWTLISSTNIEWWKVNVTKSMARANRTKAIPTKNSAGSPSPLLSPRP